MVKTLRNERVPAAIKRAAAAHMRNVTKAPTKYLYTVDLANEVRTIKERSIQRWKESLKEAMDHITDNKGHAYLPKQHTTQDT